MLSASIQVHNEDIRRTKNQCQSQQKLRTGVKPKQHNQGSITHTLQLNRYEVQVMAAIKLFLWKRIAENPLDIIVFGMTELKKKIQSKMTPLFG